MSASALATFNRYAERLAGDPHAIAERLRDLLAVDGRLAPEHQRPGRDTYRQHLLYVSPTRRLSVVAPAGPGKTISIHVYGADIERLGSSILRRYDDVTQRGAAA